MKIITLKQPWASLIAEGHKTIETRTHKRFAGLRDQTIGIHAGKTWDYLATTIVRRGVVWAGSRVTTLPDCLRRLVDKGVSEYIFGVPEFVHAHGAIIATAYVSRFGRLEETDSRAALCPADGLWGLFLRDVRKLDEPIPCPGKQGIWHFDVPGEKASE